MDIKRCIIGTIVGTIILNFFGYIIWERALADFFAANAGSATGVYREVPLRWAVTLGYVSYAALLTLAIETRARSSTIVEGFKIAAIVGFLFWFSVNFFLYGFQNVWNLTATIADSLLSLMHAGIAGAIIAAVLGKIAN